MSRFLDGIGGVFFYGTPHHGMDGLLSKYLELNSLTANKSLLKFVQVLSTESARLQDEFVIWRKVYGWKIYGVAETQAVESWGRGTDIGIWEGAKWLRSIESVRVCAFRVGGNLRWVGLVLVS